MHADIDTSIVHVYISVCTICTYGDPFYREIEIEVEIETKTNKQQPEHIQRKHKHQKITVSAHWTLIASHST